MSISYNKDYIISQLSNGVDLDTIADELTKMLNAANKEFQEQEQAAYKLEDANTVAEVINDFIQDYYPTLLSKDETITGKNVIELFDSIVELSKSMEDLRSLVKEPVKSRSKEVSSYDNELKAIEDFLKKYNI